MIVITEEEATTFGDWAYLAVAKHTTKFQKYEVGVLDDQDPENLHQMRVGMRRLRSAITGFGLGLKLPQNAGEKNVGKIAKILGELRDLDVLLDTLQNKYQPDLPPKEQKELNKVLKKLAQQRIKVFKKVKSLLQSSVYYRVKNSLKKWLEKPDYQKVAQVGINEILPDLLLPQISQFLLHQGWFVGVEFKGKELEISENLSSETVNQLLESQGEDLHSLRKEAKRTRYQMELFTQFYGDDYQNYLNDIKDIQTVLGDIQDSVVLRDCLQTILGKKLEQKMPVFSKLLLDNRYQKWQEWRKLQTKFLSVSNRQDFHHLIINNNLIEREEKPEQEPPISQENENEQTLQLS